MWGAQVTNYQALAAAFPNYLTQAGAGNRDDLTAFYRNEFGAKYRETNPVVPDPDSLLANVNDNAIKLQNSYIAPNNTFPIGEKGRLDAGVPGVDYDMAHGAVQPRVRGGKECVGEGGRGGGLCCSCETSWHRVDTTTCSLRT